MNKTNGIFKLFAVYQNKKLSLEFTVLSRKKAVLDQNFKCVFLLNVFWDLRPYRKQRQSLNQHIVDQELSWKFFQTLLVLTDFVKNKTTTFYDNDHIIQVTENLFIKRTKCPFSLNVSQKYNIYRIILIRFWNKKCIHETTYCQPIHLVSCIWTRVNWFQNS